MLEQIIGKKSQPLAVAALQATAEAFDELHIDLGTGDGKFAYRSALNNPKNFYIGIDADRNSLADCSSRAAKKPARGGCENVAFLCMNLLQPSEDLKGLADHLHINFPWGSLMEAVAFPDVHAMQRMASLAKPQAKFDYYLNLYVFANEEQRERMGLPLMDESYVTETLIPKMREAGWAVEEHTFLEPEALKDHPSSWAGRLIRRSGRATLHMKGTVNP